ncbi:VanZ family protein [Pseudemcibacter aquimaris]|uniref:VanZ family protein n=1 Tax=Pseudemcibacter aquimaris TaxID=2857064 RepID=UPI002012EA15|nr:VanZ family protein [Pseudemcibacter aquimaris]MCC3860064.1 VanZ family protein [Pseudemcibacter aquimaris]WDU57393.1 VanZ family protein [Pseudemcibacter aquimaris]
MKISHNKRKAVWGLMVLVVVVLSLLPQDNIPVKMPFTDKTAHFVTYAILSFFALLSSRQKHSLFAILAVQIFIGTFLEGAQSFVPGRMPEFLDIVANSLGVLLGAIAYFIFRKIKPIEQK